MGYKALVTLDLPNVTTEQRKNFYEVLIKEGWNKINDLDTAWKVIFQDGGTRNGAITIIVSHIKKAKEISKASRVNYALQIDLNDLVIDKIV
ncbi:hypothetical protein V3468_05070 [Flavobacterium oreochromis]|uniref:hypothetical protein n=1 Tax=Flavobacterium oreochromis TaxID=2906078 RepID=UPI000B4D183A|nr:hypothetical protein [Flavobacterium oreochromis]OWP75519.1 hypothetical protein BWG23_10775 [Flavobacterium oreochromis]QYS86712.1 hypothetical protein JJC03_01240 [Flavobacterium oreochromis]